MGTDGDVRIGIQIPASCAYKYITLSRKLLSDQTVFRRRWGKVPHEFNSLIQKDRQERRQERFKGTLLDYLAIVKMTQM